MNTVLHQSSSKSDKNGGRSIDVSKSRFFVCKFCVRSHQFRRKYCPTWGKSCLSCKKPNHFSKLSECPNNKESKISNITLTDNAFFLGMVREWGGEIEDVIFDS